MEQMFISRGWEITQRIREADLIQFTGGADVSPHLYGHSQHATTFPDANRDKQEAVIHNIALDYDIPMAGICRGGQFLHCMCGGTMFQDVNNHTQNHKIVDVKTGEEIEVTSTHHQMMKENPRGKVIAFADGLSTRREETSQYNIITIHTKPQKDIEVMHYSYADCLCFQPHPEFRPGACRDYYFSLIKELFNLGGE